jgi:hypothetical protein
MPAKMMNTCTQEKAVKRLLRHRDSGEYFKDGGWTNDPNEADNFADVVEVAEICAQYELNGVELVLRMDTSSSDVFCTAIR